MNRSESGGAVLLLSAESRYPNQNATILKETSHMQSPMFLSGRDNHTEYGNQAQSRT